MRAHKTIKEKQTNTVTGEKPVLELDPDAWPKFEKLIKSAAKMGPKPHAKASKS